MNLPLIDRNPTEIELERFRLFLSSYQDRMGIIFNFSYLEQVSTLLREIISAAFNLPDQNNSDSSRIFIYDKDKAVYYFIKLRTAIPDHLECANSRVYHFESSFSDNGFWERVSHFRINAQNYREDPAKTGVAAVNLIKPQNEGEYSIDLSKSSFLFLFNDSEEKMQLVQYAYWADPAKLNWLFGEDATLRGYENDNVLFEIRIPEARAKEIPVAKDTRKRRKMFASLDHFLPREVHITHVLHPSKRRWTSKIFELETLTTLQMMEYGIIAKNKKQKEITLAKLEELISIDAEEKEFQKLLKENPRILGSEYGELLDRRIWVRDNQQDFMLKRTVDGFLETLEIKRAMNDRPLFNKDDSHKTLYPGSALSKAIGQVVHYLEELDGQRHLILSEDGEDVNKIRAKLIIGRDGDEHQIKVVHNLNSHMHRIEIITYDQLVRIAKRALAYQ